MAESAPEVPRESAAPAQRRRRRVVGGRQDRHVVRVTPEEEGRLQVLALRYGVSIPKLLVDSAIAGNAMSAAANASEREAVVIELFKHQRLLANVANNLNQIARAVNIDGVARDELADTVAAARTVIRKSTDLIDELGESAR